MTNEPPDDDRTVAQPLPSTGPKTAAIPAAAAAPARQDSGNALPLGTYLDEFELRSVAGEGGFSIVYRAWDHSLKRQVALKEYFPSGMVSRSGGTQVVVRSERHTEAFEAGLRSFVEEARLLAQFDHPALIKVYRFWKANGSAYMVMPFCEGITLRDDWRARPDPPDETALMTLLDPLTEALAVLHAERWYHRDIAPDNVMLLGTNRRPLLLDFGAARQVIGDMTHALTVILKPGYAPIEQWGEVPGMKQGPWTDVYALAAMIHFGIMRRTPPPSVGRLVNDSYEPLVRVAAGRYSERFLAAIDRALAVRPEQRTQTIAQFRDEIGLNEFTRETTRTWMPPASSGATLASPDLELPGAAPAGRASLPTTAPGPEFTQQPRAGTRPMEFEARTQPMSPRPGAAPSSGRPYALFAVGLLVTGVIGLGAYALLKPPPENPTPPAPLPAPKPTPDQQPPPVLEQPPPPPPPPPEYSVTREFSRIVQAQTPGHVVEATLVRTTVRSEKDSILFTVKSMQDGVLYVFNRGSDGSLLLVYPNKKSGLLRVRANTATDLPRQIDDEFKVSGPSGTSELLILASRLPRELPAPARVDFGYSYFQTGRAASSLAAQHDGPLPWFVGRPKCPSSEPCADEFGAAVVTFNVVQ